MLGASRRNDWSTQDLAALSAHLSSCADCRKVEAAFRGVGEQIRDLPSIQAHGGVMPRTEAPTLRSGPKRHPT